MFILNEGSEKYLLLKIIEGSEKAYEKLFMRYYPLLCAFAKRYVDEDSAENIVQDVMLWIWENRHTLTPDIVISQYLLRAVRNRCLNLLTHNATKLQAFSHIKEQIYENNNYYDYVQVKELREKIAQAVAELPEDYRKAFELNRYQSMTYSQIADHLGVSPKTIDYRITQSLKILRQKLKNFL